MSLLFGAASTDRVDIGASTEITTQAALSFVVWLRANTASVARNIFVYPQTASQTIFNLTGGNNVQCTINRATTSLLILAPVANFAAWSLNEWVCIAARIDTNGADTDQQAFIGRNRLPLEPPSAYSTQRAGSGTPQANSGTPIIGNNATPNAPWKGDIAYLKIFNVALTQGQLVQEQFSDAPVNSNCVGYYRFGYFGVGQQVDFRAGNNGTVTGATWAPMPALLFRRPFPVRNILGAA